jgi:hypothetical protein
MAAAPSVSDILARFPGPVRLYPSRQKWLLLLVFSGAIAVSAVVMARNGDSSAWFGALFFGLGAISAALMLCRDAASLMLDADGFVMTNLFIRTRMRWQDTSNFEMSSMRPMVEYVGFDNITNDPKLLRPIRKLLAYHNARLADTYGLGAEDLAMLMAKWRDLACRPR